MTGPVSDRRAFGRPPLPWTLTHGDVVLERAKAGDAPGAIAASLQSDGVTVTARQVYDWLRWRGVRGGGYRRAVQPPKLTWVLDYGEAVLASVAASEPLSVIAARLTEAGHPARAAQIGRWLRAQGVKRPYRRKGETSARPVPPPDWSRVTPAALPKLAGQIHAIMKDGRPRTIADMIHAVALRHRIEPGPQAVRTAVRLLGERGALVVVSGDTAPRVWEAAR